MSADLIMCVCMHVGVCMWKANRKYSSVYFILLYLFFSAPFWSIQLSFVPTLCHFRTKGAYNIDTCIYTYTHMLIYISIIPSACWVITEGLGGLLGVRFIFCASLKFNKDNTTMFVCVFVCCFLTFCFILWRVNLCVCIVAGFILLLLFSSI